MASGAHIRPRGDQPRRRQTSRASADSVSRTYDWLTSKRAGAIAFFVEMQQPRKRQRTATTATTATAPKQPNILIIVADDLVRCLFGPAESFGTKLSFGRSAQGYSDLGCYGSEISTPHLDLLAREGSRMLNFHTTPSDSPTRAELLTGVPAHLCGLGCQLEYKDTPWGAARWAGRPGYEGFLTRRVATIGEILRERGYFTAIAGKVCQKKLHGRFER